MTQPTKREQLAAMRVEDFKAHLRVIAGQDPKREISGAPRPNPLLVRNRKKAVRGRRSGGAESWHPFSIMKKQDDSPIRAKSEF
jgi:hypothetical protein